jgi:hypothetical protein
LQADENTLGTTAANIVYNVNAFYAMVYYFGVMVGFPIKIARPGACMTRDAVHPIHQHL